MYVDNKTLNDLEWFTVLKHLAQHASSELGKELCMNLMPLKDKYDVDEALLLTSEAKEMVQLMIAPPLGGIYDIRNYIKKAQVGSSLENRDFIDIVSTLVTSRSIKSHFVRYNEEYPGLYKLSSFIMDHQKLIDSIYRCFDQGGNIQDTASPLLKQLRDSLRDQASNLKEKINNLVHSPSVVKYLQEPVYTLRNNRYVLPVKAEHKSDVPGIVHDSSASGMTIYIEPRSIVELNNKIKEIELKIDYEIQRILMELTQKIANYSDELYITLEFLSQIDFIFAKAKYSQAIDAGRAEINNDKMIELKLAKHPILIKSLNKVIPNTVKLGGEYNTLIITGANTGGKTVLLKTIGLCVLMTASGLHIPADTGSSIYLYSSLFAEINDEQSLENNLSTFSSHMTNIINIVNNTNSESLVLLDELGAGTDPAEGTALAQALLEHLQSKGTTSVITTHYGGLKTLAFSHKGFRNASVEFDIEKLIPTYKLLMDIPGKSNAVTIAKSLGLIESVSSRAEEIFDSSQDDMSVMLEEFQKIHLKLSKKLETAEINSKTATELKENYEKVLEDMNENKIRSLSNFKKKLNSELNRARSEVIQIMQELKNERTEKSAKQAHSKLAGLEYDSRENVDHMVDGDVSKKEKPSIDWKKVKIGDRVFIEKIKQEGTLLSLPDNNNRVSVQIGQLKSILKTNELKLSTSKSKKIISEPRFESRSAVTKNLRRDDIKNTIDLRGKTVDEALLDLEIYLDKAALNNFASVVIIHGHGTGLLRKAVREYLKESAYVKDYRPGELNEGGDGISIVELK